MSMKTDTKKTTENKSKLDRSKKLSSLFAYLDKDESGYLEENEVLILLRNLKGKKADSKKALKALHKMDKNSDGKVESKEFVSFFKKMTAKLDDTDFENKVHIMFKSRRELMLESVFFMFDRDGNGGLDENEFANLVRLNKTYYADPGEILETFIKFDTEGTDRVLDMKEYKNYMLMVMGRLDDNDFFSTIKKMKAAGREAWTRWGK
mmetsp:Transcript_17024/g.25549  ORF Transcript_17024/g.25549 Transcript_17024/m.25549 type:complete len:207 (-) Transcript_17024:156-776(-)|eukprot:CAMPEP_0167742014 /NCGR_PEP_ID=MMETSP0110_2-20121227/1179_1 /TAXON_ID=629695 /ORGANISM="Gymnochlora sp., Strain CCMP2014" /LENGTH=206 /DNA_ID=CAMNT_0007626135 /DNA_START=86 /DNA_END=706 /DNA_ORIENTATION=+